MEKTELPVMAEVEKTELPAGRPRRKKSARPVTAVTFAEGSIGLAIERREDGKYCICVESVMEGGQGAESGKVSDGDLMVSIAGEPLAGVGWEESVTMLQSAARPVTIEFVRGGAIGSLVEGSKVAAIFEEGSLGLELIKMGGGEFEFVVNGLIPDTQSAGKAGIEPGLLVIAVGGNSTSYVPAEEVVSLITASARPVEVTFARPTAKYLESHAPEATSPLPAEDTERAILDAKASLAAIMREKEEAMAKMQALGQGQEEAMAKMQALGEEAAAGGGGGGGRSEGGGTKSASMDEMMQFARKKKAANDKWKKEKSDWKRRIKQVYCGLLFVCVLVLIATTLSNHPTVQSYWAKFAARVTHTAQAEL